MEDPILLFFHHERRFFPERPKPLIKLIAHGEQILTRYFASSVLQEKVHPVSAFPVAAFVINPQ